MESEASHRSACFPATTTALQCEIPLVLVRSSTEMARERGDPDNASSAHVLA